MIIRQLKTNLDHGIDSGAHHLESIVRRAISLDNDDGLITLLDGNRSFTCVQAWLMYICEYMYGTCFVRADLYP